jgi:hypothetical protein
MPKNTTEDYGKLFIAGLEKWERPYAAGDEGAEGLSEAAVAARFIRGLENWEWPMRPAPGQVIIYDQSVTALTRPLWLRVQGSIEVFASRAAEIWAGVPVLVERVGAGVVRAARLDAGGHADFKEVTPGEYRVIASPVSGFLGAYGMSLEGEPKTYDKTPMIAVHEQNFSAHGLNVSVTLQPHGEIALTFATQDPDLAGGVVRFAFAEPEGGRVQISGVVELEAQPGKSDHWAGNWQYRLAITGVCELMFNVEGRK